MSDAIVGWTKLNHKCEVCEQPYSDIMFEYRCNDPFPNMTRVESYHWKCLPIELKQFQAQNEAAMWDAAQQPL